MDIRLLRTGIDDLSPGHYRSPGIHVSTLLSRLCIRFGHYEKKKDGSPISDRNREIGNAFEHSIVERAARKWPGKYIHNPEIRCDGVYVTPDLVSPRYGISWSLKCTWMSPARDPEDTKMWKYLEQLKEELYCLRRVLQGTAQIRGAAIVENEADLAAVEQSWGILRNHDHQRCSLGVGCDEAGICYAVAHGKPEMCPAVGGAGDSFLTGLLTVCFVNDFRPEKEQIPTWTLSFFPEELEMTHAMVMGERARFLDEGGCEWCGAEGPIDNSCFCCRECGGMVWDHREGCACG